MVKRYLRKAFKKITFINLVALLLLVTFSSLIALVFYPNHLTFGAFIISQEPLTLGEIGGFIGGILSPLTLLLIFLTLKAQHDELHASEKRHWRSTIDRIENNQPKLSFKYLSYEYDEDKYEVSFNFLVINIGQDALDFKITVGECFDEDDLSNFLKDSYLDHIPNYANNADVILKLTFYCIDKASIQEETSIKLFCYYQDISQVGRAFYANFIIEPRSDIGFKAEIKQIDRAI
jgi:hypothetical protein